MPVLHQQRMRLQRQFLIPTPQVLPLLRPDFQVVVPKSELVGHGGLEQHALSQCDRLARHPTSNASAA